jgi:hypothetical protein
MWGSRSGRGLSAWRREDLGMAGRVVEIVVGSRYRSRHQMYRLSVIETVAG